MNNCQIWNNGFMGLGIDKLMCNRRKDQWLYELMNNRFIDGCMGLQIHGLFKGIYRGYTLVGRPETTKIFHLNVTNLILIR